MKEYDIIGYDFELFWFKPYKNLENFSEKIEKVENKKVFILSTSIARENNKYI